MGTAGREQPDPAVQRLAALGVLASNCWREGREQLPKDCGPSGVPVPHSVFMALTHPLFFALLKTGVYVTDQGRVGNAAPCVGS